MVRPKFFGANEVIGDHVFFYAKYTRSRRYLLEFYSNWRMKD